MTVQDFYKKLARYTPSDGAKRTLSGLTDYKMRVDKDRRYIEIDISFEKIVPKEELYTVEEEIKKQYELASVRILPEYPASEFNFNYQKTQFIS